MATINLRDYYKHCEDGIQVEVSPAVQEVLQGPEKPEKQDNREKVNRYRHKAWHSFDQGIGIEAAVLFPPEQPEDAYERKVEAQQLYAAMKSLPEKQRRRVYAFYILGQEQSQIARQEGVTPSAVCMSIQRGLQRMKKILLKTR